MRTGKDWIEALHLREHLEGGWYTRVYTASVEVDTPDGKRAASSAIHYLLTEGAPMGYLHRNKSSILHFMQSGGPVDYFLLS